MQQEVVASKPFKEAGRIGREMCQEDPEPKGAQQFDDDDRDKAWSRTQEAIDKLALKVSSSHFLLSTLIV